MRLFHASNIEIKQPKIINRFKTLDFGIGFYTISNKEQAEAFAHKVYYRNKKKLTGLQIYFLYHIESPANFVAEIDERLK